MIFNDSVSFDITVNGEASDVRKFVDYLLSGTLDEFFPIDEEYLSFDDDFEEASDTDSISVLFSSDEFGVEVEEFDSDEFLEVICKAGKALYLSGSFYNFDDDEFRFVSYAGDPYYMNANKITDFNDELDREALREREEEEDDE